MRGPETKEDEPWEAGEDEAKGDSAPGLVLIFSGGRPSCEVMPLHQGALVLGRGDVAGVHIDDERMSRAHARVSFDGRRWSVQDLGSRNGTAVDGEKLPAGEARAEPRFVRTGSSLFLPVSDVAPFRAKIARVGAMMMGPSMQRAWKAVLRAARTARVLHVTGESGTGKELAARAFHDASPSHGGPFVAVNSASLVENLAERLLFGARKGAYSGAVDAKGFVQSAHGGTLFLDELAELDLGVQAKLLRVLETGEVVPLGATAPERVDIRLCSATHADLRARVTEGKMRADLFFRLGTPRTTLPPLRERPEEIPWLVAHALHQGEATVERDPPARPLSPHVSLVEACLLRHWSGNVRELLAEVRHAAELAADEGALVLARHLDPAAGRALEAQPAPAPAPPSAPLPSRPSDETIAEALRASGGNVSRASRALRMHRTQLYRWIAEQKGRAEAAKD